jgi:hypothetical protein
VKYGIGSWSLGLFVCALCSLLPGKSHAGLGYPPPAPFCVTYSGGTGWCQGTFAGFRADPDPNTYAGVTTSTWGNSLYFFANYHGTYAGCLVPWGPGWESLQGQITRLPLHRGPFTVYFDQNGYCTNIAIYEFSYYEP